MRNEATGGLFQKHGIECFADNQPTSKIIIQKFFAFFGNKNLPLCECQLGDLSVVAKALIIQTIIYWREGESHEFHP